MGKTYYLRIPLLLLACSSAVFAENVANISDSLAVETTVDAVKVTSSITPVTKSKTEKRDSSDRIGPTALTLKEAALFRPITSATYQQWQPQPQQFPSSPAPNTFQPTTVRYIAEEAAPQVYYDRPSNGRPVSGPSNDGKLLNFVDDSIHYGTPIHTIRRPFKGSYHQHFEQPQPRSLQQQQQYHLKQQYNPQQHVQALKLQPSLSYVPTSGDGGFIPSELQLQKEQPPQKYRQQHKHTQQQQQDEYSQQQQPVILKNNSQQQQPYVAIEKQPQSQQYQQQQQQQPQQHQQQQYQQPSRQQIHYIIAIPLSYVRQLQYKLAAQHGATTPSLPPPQHQQQTPPSATFPLEAPRAPLPPLFVLQPVGAGEGGGSSSSSLSRELYRTQQPLHYVPHAPGPAAANHAAGPHIQLPAALAPQQLPYPMNLALTALARPRPAVYPASQLLYVQPQLIHHTPLQQLLQLQVKQPHHLPRYAHVLDQQQTHAVEERNTQLSKLSQPQQNPHQGTPRSGPKPKVSQVSSPPPSVVTSSISPPPAVLQVATALPIQSPLSVAPPVLFYGSPFAQPPLEQHFLPPSPYASPFQGQLGPAQNAATMIKLSSPSALLAPQTALAPPYYPIQPPPGGASLGPRSFLVAKASLQLQQSSHQHQPPALSAFTSRPALYVAPQDAAGSIGGAQWSGAGLPYFIHPAGVHYGTHLYNSGTPLVAQKLLENVENADVDNQQQQQRQQQHLRPESDRKQQQQQSGSTATSGGNDENNAIVKYP